MRRHLALALILLLMLPMVAESTGSLTIPVVFGSLAGPSTQNLSLYDASFNAVRDYVNQRELSQATCSTRPAASISGRLFFCTDTATLYADTGAAWTAIATQALYANDLSGLTTATVSQVNQITVNAGAAASDDATVTNRVMMTLASATQGNTAGTWVAGNFQNKLDAGVLGANQTWHIYAIQRTDTSNVDILFSQSATAPTMPTNYTKKRALGAFLTNASSNLIGYVQRQDEFWFVTVPDLDVSTVGATVGATAFTASATVANGVRVQAILNVQLDNDTTSSNALYLSSLDTTDMTPSITISPLGTVMGGTTANSNYGGQVRIWTDTARSYRARLATGGAADAVRIATLGFVYPRRP